MESLQELINAVSKFERYSLPFPTTCVTASSYQDWGFATPTPPKTSIAIISGTNIHRIDRNKSPLNISGKVAVA